MMFLTLGLVAVRMAVLLGAFRYSFVDRAGELIDFGHFFKHIDYKFVHRASEFIEAAMNSLTGPMNL